MKKTFCDWCGKEMPTYEIKIPECVGTYDGKRNIKDFLITGGEVKADICSMCLKKIWWGMNASSLKHILDRENFVVEE